MNPRLIALAVAGALSAPVHAATGNLEIYGVFDASLNLVDHDTSSVENEIQFASNTSRFGLRGAEELGGGVAALWQYETGLAIDAGQGFGSTNAIETYPTFRDYRLATQAGARDVFLGLSSKTLGTLKVGRLNTAYKNSTNGYDVFKDGLGDYNSIMGAVEARGEIFNARESNSVSYESPSIEGVGAAVSYGQRNEAGALAMDRQLWSVALKYENGPLTAVAAYEKHDDGFAAGVEDDAWKIGASYLFGDTRIAAIYERITLGDVFGATGDTERDAWYVGITHRAGKVTLKAAYARADDSENDLGSNLDGANQFTLGVDYGFSSRTTAYALYTFLDQEALSSWYMGASSTTHEDSSNPGTNPRGLSLGVKHSF
jgi:predicted porin